MKPTISPTGQQPPDPELQNPIEDEIHQAHLKRERNLPLTDREWMLIQYSSGGTCASCNSKLS